jgi:crotonobetaine/carnitine-CoA ligase
MASEQPITTYPELIEHQARAVGDKPYILHEGESISFTAFDRATCRAANGLTRFGAEAGDGVALLMGNCIEYLYLFHGIPRAGLYSIPVNTALKGEGLAFILTNSEAKFLVIDDTLYRGFEKLGGPVGQIHKVFVRRTSEKTLPQGTHDLQELLDATDKNPDHAFDPEAVSYLMYTSGTTGLPKGVVNRNSQVNIPGYTAVANMAFTPEDVLYTALPLFHANALIVTAGFALCRGIPIALERRFSASGFWDSVRRYGGTSFNALGAMVPILMKQPEKPDDGDNPVRLVITSACPTHLWEPFAKRFDVTIWEAYGAVDGGGVSIFNFGDAPVGSVGKIITDHEWKLVDDDGNEMPTGQIGELITRSPQAGSSSVEYFKNPEASQKKVRGGWTYSGDYFYADKDGNLFFVDRKNDCMRRRGENISSFEVENILEKHPDIQECAAFGVPSDLGEDEVMIWIKPREGVRPDFEALMQYCKESMAYFMIPRYVEIVDHIPRTETLRVQKGQMKKRGVTENTWDREQEMPDFKLK